jgi:hypothetical protein
MKLFQIAVFPPFRERRNNKDAKSEIETRYGNRCLNRFNKRIQIMFPLENSPGKKGVGRAPSGFNPIRLEFAVVK